MLNTILNLLPAFVVLGVLIFVHELGHFIACRICKVKVEKFSIGFGPALFSWQTKKTRYVISLIPFGGFVKPSGESYDEVREKGLGEHDFLAQKVHKRFFIIFAGVAMNYILAFLLFVAIFMVGKPILSSTIGGFIEDYPAINSGMLEGDQIIAVNGEKVKNWFGLTDKIAKTEGGDVTFTVLRGNDILDFSVTPKIDEVKDIFGKEKSIPRIGIKPADDYIIEQYGALDSVKYSFQALTNFTVLTYKAIYYLITGRMSLKTVSGPVGIITVTSKTANLGLIYLLQLVAILSVSLAIFNLLPFPPLDGGLLFFLMIEAIMRKPVNIKVQERVTQAGYALLILLMIVVMYNDFAKLEIFQKLNIFFTKP